MSIRTPYGWNRCTPLCGKNTRHWLTGQELFCNKTTQDLIPLKQLKINSCNLRGNKTDAIPSRYFRLSSFDLLLVPLHGSLSRLATLQQPRPSMKKWTKTGMKVGSKYWQKGVFRRRDTIVSTLNARRHLL